METAGPQFQHKRSLKHSIAEQASNEQQNKQDATKLQRVQFLSFDQKFLGDTNKVSTTHLRHDPRNFATAYKSDSKSPRTQLNPLVSNVLLHTKLRGLRTLFLWQRFGRKSSNAAPIVSPQSQNLFIEHALSESDSEIHCLHSPQAKLFKNSNTSSDRDSNTIVSK